MVAERMKHDLLDRPVHAEIGPTCERLAWFLIAGAAAFTRLMNLGIRAMSHDESMHAYYSYLLYDAGAYQHDPALHGPLLFHLNALVYFLVGDSDFTARIVPALSGIALILTLYAFRRYLGRWGALCAAFLVLISPSILFYSRYLVIDSFVVLASLTWTYGAFRYLEEQRPQWLYLVVTSMALSVTAKENAFIFGATVGAFFAALAIAQKLTRTAPFRRSPAADLSVLMFTLVLPFTAPAIHLLLGWGNAVFTFQGGLSRSLWLVASMAAAAVVIAWLWFGRARSRTVESGCLDFRLWAALMASFWLVQLVLFTTFLTNFGRGFSSGIIGSLAYWFEQHGVRRGGAPWFYYLVIGSLYEFLPMLLAACGVVTLLRVFRLARLAVAPQPGREESQAAAVDPVNSARVTRERTLFGAFALWWAVVSWQAYSFAGERMPWLLVHISFPTILLGSWWLGWTIESAAWKKAAWKGTTWLIACVPVLGLVGAGLASTAPFAGRTLDQVWLTLRWLTGLILFLALFALILRAVRCHGTVAVARGLSVGLVLLLTLMTVRSSAMLNFRNYDSAVEPLVYAHATPDIKITTSEIEAVLNRAAQPDSPLVCYDDDSTWPFAWYFRRLPRVHYYGTQPDSIIATSPVVIVGPKNSDKVKPLLGANYVKRTRILIWWPAEEYYGLTFRKAWDTVTSRSQLHELWQVALHRRYSDISPSQWPRRHEFEVYLRKDVAARIWGTNRPDELSLRSTAGSLECLPELVPPSVEAFKGVYGGKPLQSPRAVAVSRDGSIVIADTGNDRVVVLDSGGHLLRALGRRCRLEQGAAGGCTDEDGNGPLQAGDGQFLEPWGVAVSREGRIFLADTWNGRIQAFDPAGRFLWKWGSFGSTGGVNADPHLLFGPRGLALSIDGELLVTDTGNKRVLRFRESGEFLSQAGGLGVFPGRFNEPVGIAIDPSTRDVLVADAWNQRIQRLNAKLEYLKEWPVSGWTARDAESKPFLAVDSEGNVFVTDPAQSRVLAFDSRGNLRHYLRDMGAELGRMNHPTGIAVDPSDKALWVADSGNNRVLKLRGMDRTVDRSTVR
jgi:uncharacterized protein (TIGR03663 family)